MPRPPTPVPFIETGNPAVDRLQRFVAQALPGKQDAWTAPTLLNSWVNFNPTANSVAGYMKDAMGFVHLRGTIKSGVVGIGTAVFVLPSGYRPTRGSNFPVVSNSAFGYVFVDANGNVQVGAGSNVYVDLDGINFDTR